MNDILRNIQKQIVDPSIGRIKQSVKGYIAVVYPNEHKCDVHYFDDSGMKRRIKRLDLPEQDNGLYTDDPRAGDRVEISFRNQSDSAVYISRVFRRRNAQSDAVTGGQDLPVSTDLF